MTIERDEEILVWSRTEETAMAFVGRDRAKGIRVVKERPETDEEKKKYYAGSKLFAVKVR